MPRERVLQGITPSSQPNSSANRFAPYLTRTSVSRACTPQLTAFWKDIRVFSGASCGEKEIEKVLEEGTAQFALVQSTGRLWSATHLPHLQEGPTELQQTLA